MANRKMIPPGGVKLPVKKQNPPPPEAFDELNKYFELAQLKPDVLLFMDGVLLRFTQLTELVLMTSKGARDMAKKLNEMADELDRKKEAEKK